MAEEEVWLDGAKLKALREGKGEEWTQGFLAIKSGVPQPKISQYESGARKNVKISTIYKLARALSVPADELVVHRKPAPPALERKVPRRETPAVARLRRRLEDMRAEIDQISEAIVPDVVRLPILGHVPAGGLFPEEETPLGHVPLPTEWVQGAKRPYLLIVTGDSMANDLEPGDMIVVDPDRAWKNGSIVVAMVENETTVKRIERLNGKVRLVPANKAHKEIVVKEQEVRVLGVVVHRIKTESLL